MLCVASDPDTLEVRGAIVLHQDPALLPRSLIREMESDATAEGRSSIDEYVTFCFLFEDEDRVALYMDGDPTCLLKQIDGLPTLDAARATALDWVGPSANEYSFHHMPGIYQTALVKFVKDYQAELDPIEMAWYLPSPVQDDLMLVRDFPPRLEPTPITPEPGRVSWVMMPRGAVQELYRQRGF